MTAYKYPMKPVKDGLTARPAVKLLFYTLFFDTIIALFLTAMKFGGGWTKPWRRGAAWR